MTLQFHYELKFFIVSCFIDILSSIESNIEGKVDTNKYIEKIGGA